VKEDDMAARAAASTVPSRSPAGIPWWELPADEVAARLGSDPHTGLTPDQAARRLRADGPNQLQAAKTRPAWRLFAAQFANTVIMVLLAAAVVTAVVGDLKDTVVIAAVVLLNAAISFVQERRAEQAVAALKRMSAPTARVVRAGRTRTVAVAEVVPGDLLDLEAGDIVAADARLLEAPNLRVNEAALTGESVPVDKHPAQPQPAEAELPLAERRNMVFTGTAVSYGRGRALVTATGMATALGQIAELLQARRPPPTPLQRRLAVLGRDLAVAVVAACAVVFAVGVLVGEPVVRMLVVGVSLAVAAIPESLPAVVTLSLALGAHRMARQRAIVRKLSAVEALGSVTVIATDKTGTLTQGRMQVERVWAATGEVEVSGSGYSPNGAFRTVAGGQQRPDPAGGQPLGRLLVAGALANDAALLAPAVAGGAWEVAGDPTEGALLALAAKAGVDHEQLKATLPRVAEVPFDATRKRMTTIHRSSSGELLVASKGALEAILPRARMLAGPHGPRPISAADLAELGRQAERYAADGYRVLAIAGRTLRRLPAHPEDAEHDLVLYGLVAMADPPRPEAAKAVATARQAGIRPVMVTGDHPATARAIAARLGILDHRRMLTGSQLTRGDAGTLADHVAEVAVYARTTPEHKLDIVGAWQARGDVVAMTGDGVNDAPALRRADIGVAMGQTGTEVAKQAADMVLADDNFATIVSAVAEGRRIYDNIRRFVRYGLTGGSAEIWVMLLAPLLGLPLALLPVQILWINLLTHGLPGLALGVEPAEPDVMRRQPRRPDERILAGGLWQHVLAMGLLTGMVSLGLGVWGHATARPWQTMIFTSLALLQLGNALAVRSERQSLFRRGLGGNRFLGWTVLGTLLLQLAVVYWPPAQAALELQPLSLADLAVVLAASTAAFWAIEAQKLIARHRVAVRLPLGVRTQWPRRGAGRVPHR
jgi:Ca2+-transporting ATPase